MVGGGVVDRKIDAGSEVAPAKLILGTSSGWMEPCVNPADTAVGGVWLKLNAGDASLEFGLDCEISGCAGLPSRNAGCAPKPVLVPPNASAAAGEPNGASGAGEPPKENAGGCGVSSLANGAGALLEPKLNDLFVLAAPKLIALGAELTGALAIAFAGVDGFNPNVNGFGSPGGSLFSPPTEKVGVASLAGAVPKLKAGWEAGLAAEASEPKAKAGVEAPFAASPVAVVEGVGVELPNNDGAGVAGLGSAVDVPKENAGVGLGGAEPKEKLGELVDFVSSMGTLGASAGFAPKENLGALAGFAPKELLGASAGFPSPKEILAESAGFASSRGTLGASAGFTPKENLGVSAASFASARAPVDRSAAPNKNLGVPVDGLDGSEAPKENLGPEDFSRSPMDNPEDSFDFAGAPKENLGDGFAGSVPKENLGASVLAASASEPSPAGGCTVGSD